jgi:SnoaL-like domain
MLCGFYRPQRNRNHEPAVRYGGGMKIVPLSSALLSFSSLAIVFLVSSPLVAQTMPPLKRQATPAKVVEEHMAAFSSCDWPRLMAQFPDNVEFFGPNGQVVRGKAALGKMFAQVVKKPSEGGTCGLSVVAEHTFVVGDTINVQWRADSPLLKEPYRGADAYETHDGLMAAQVTTWNPAELKWKVPPTSR